MVLIISAVFPPEPVVSAQISNDLAYYLSENEYVEVLCPNPTRPRGTIYNSQEDVSKPFKERTINSFTYPGPSLFCRMMESISFGMESTRLVKAHRNDIKVIYTNTWPLFAQYFVARAAHKFKIPMVIHVQDIYPETLTDRLSLIGPLVKALLLPIDKYVMKHSDSIIAIGNKMAEYLEASRKVDKSKISVLYNWQDESRFDLSNMSVRFDPRFTFMYLGSLSPSANIEGVIDAFGKSELKKSKFIIAGNGNSKKSCINSASKYPNLDIEFIEAPSETTPALLSLADVLVLPLKKGVGKYSIPSKLAGYMHSGKPVLAYIDTESDAADIVTTAGCGWVIAAGDETALVKKMKVLETLPGTTLSMIGTSGRSYALQHLSKKANLEKLAQIIEQTASGAMQRSRIKRL